MGHIARKVYNALNSCLQRDTSNHAKH